MIKKLVCAMIFACTSIAAFAHDTKPGDVVNVYLMQSDGYTIVSEKRYSKPWSQIKLGADTLKKISAEVNKIKASNKYPGQSYKIASVILVDTTVSRVTLVSNYSDVLVLDLPSKQKCEIISSCQNSLDMCSRCSSL